MDFIRSSVALGIALATSLATGLPSLAATVAVPVTSDNSGSGCLSAAPASDASGSIAAWQSNCDPAGTNPDGSLEVFRAVVGSAPAQLTTGAGCSSGRPSVSADGLRIAFESSCNLAGSNADGNSEIFLWKNGSFVQLTTSTLCENLSPSINGPGTVIAFDSTCNTSGTNNDGRGSEIFRVSASGVLKQLTVDAVGACDSTSPSIDRSGNLVAFDSDCDLTGENEDLAIEIFTVTSAGVVKQRTFAPDDSCSSVRPSMDEEGLVIGFHSDCDFLGTNKDRNDEVFTVAVNSPFAIRQVTNVPASGACASGEVHMASSGSALAFSSYCALNGSNGDGSIEVFHAGLGSSSAGILAVTGAGSSCSSLAGGISADGQRVMFDSDCKIAASNADGSVEVFRAAACACGAPATRGNEPKTSDALLVLRAAVKTSSCALCECDTNNSGDVSASDALLTLRKAVGQAVTLTCPAG